MATINGDYNRSNEVLNYIRNSINNHKEDPVKLAYYVSDLTKCYRKLAFQSFLTEYDTKKTIEYLHYSSTIWLHYMIKVVAGFETEPERIGLTQLAPFFTALVCENHSLISTLSCFSYKQYESEYEGYDSYLYAYSLHMLSSPDLYSNSNIFNLLDHFEENIRPLNITRLEICRALSQNDQELFSELFLTFYDLRESELENELISLSHDETEFIISQNIFLEGLALLKVAKLRGIEIDDEYDFIPSELLNTPTDSFNQPPFAICKLDELKESINFVQNLDIPIEQKSLISSYLEGIKTF